MELKEFVSQSLLQIFEGVHQAQKETQIIGGVISPKITAPHREHQSFFGMSHNLAVILVDFDVSVTTVDATNSKAGFGLFIAAFGGGAQTGSESSNNQLSRLRFSVPVALPQNVPTTEQ